MSNISHYIQVENDRQSRIQNAGAALFSGERERLADIRHKTELALARSFGSKLAPEVVTRLLEGQILEPQVLCTVSGGLNEMPKTPEAWDVYAKGLVKADPLAKRCLDFRDASLREGFRQEALQGLDSSTKMSMSRANTLDAYLEDTIRRRLDDRAGG